MPDEVSKPSIPLFSSRYNREDAIVREFAYLSSKNKITLKKERSRLSVINYTPLLQDVADQLGLSSGTGIIDASYETGTGYEAGVIVTEGGTSSPLQGQSGKSLSVVKTITIPSSVPAYLHGGDDCTSYSYWCHKLGWTQGKIAKVWINKGQPHDSRNIGVLGGHLTIAMKETFGVAGDLVKVTCSDGLAFSAVLVDIKGADAKSPYGHTKGNEISPCEWYIWTGNDNSNSVSGFPGIGSWKGKKVAKVENFGSWLNN